MTAKFTILNQTNNEMGVIGMVNQSNFGITIDGVEYVQCQHCGRYEVAGYEEPCLYPVTVDRRGWRTEDKDIELWCARCRESFAVQCDYCHEYVPKTNTHEFGEDTLCNYCYDTETTTCEMCGDRVYLDTTCYVEGYGNVCEGCSDEVEYCDHCEEYYLRNDTREVIVGEGETERWCYNCLSDAHECSDCGNLVSDSVAETDGNDTVICPNCMSNWRICSECGCLENISDVHFVNGYPLCDYCYGETEEGQIEQARREAERERIRQEQEAERERRMNSLEGNFQTLYPYHGYRLNWLPQGIAKLDDGTWDFISKLLIGIEMENDGTNISGQREANILRFTTALGFPNNVNRMIVAETDGSLSSSKSFEAITQPMTLDTLKNVLNLHAGFEELRKMGYEPHNTGTCGLHIHANREYGRARGKSDCTLEQAMVILFSNNEYWLKPFSRRRRWGYCELYGNNHSMMDFTRDMFDGNRITNNTAAEKISWIRDFYHGHGVALNFSGSNTIEFRVFRGTRKVQTLYAAAELVEMFMNVARDYTLEELCDKRLDFFKSYATELGFTNFMEYLDTRNIA